VNKKLLIAIVIVSVLLVVLIALNLKKTKGSAASLSGLLAQAKTLETKNNFLEAKAIYQKLIADFSNSSEVMNWQKKIEELNLRLLFSSTITAKSILYEIKSGDNLTKIAKEFKTTADLIKKSNNLSDDKILPGRKIKVWTAPFSIIVDKSQNILILKTDEEIVKTYIVSTGKNNSTPTGNFKITSKLVNPTWFKAGTVVPAGSAENILGSRWLGFNLPGYGLHGTNEPQSLGKQVTQGCVRLSKPDIEELYIIIPEGTEVTIVD
jgi:lipoprotein-anchoring transpeptidase ErfK/SrfK